MLITVEDARSNVDRVGRSGHLRTISSRTQLRNWFINVADSSSQESFSGALRVNRRLYSTF